MATISKGFIKDFFGNKLLPVTRGELVLDSEGNIALASSLFLAGTLKDSDGNGLPGLITAAERAMLQSVGTGGGISDIYKKIGLINNGLYFNNNLLNFYDTNSNATPIYIAGNDTINIDVTNNNVTIGLKTINTEEINKNQLIKGITVDTYGRVISVTDGVLSNEDIPQTLTQKQLNNCTSTDLSENSNDQAIANKKYVDAKFKALTGIATGSLKFGGSIDSLQVAISILEGAIQDDTKLNTYYKVTNSFTLENSKIHDSSVSVVINPGDTLIVWENDQKDIKYVHIPSGDDLTTITVQQGGSDVISTVSGNVVFNFAKPINAVKTSAQVISVSMQEANASQDGYLSASDYQRFSQYASKNITYTPIITGGIGSYEIGQLVLDNNTVSIYGLNNISTLALENGGDAQNLEYNPVLKFTETGVDAVSIVFQGTSGILVRKTTNGIEFTANNKVNINSSDYLEITNGSEFKAKIGSVSEDFSSVTNGLADVQLVYDIIRSYTTNFEKIEYSLNGSANSSEYRYGNDKLKAAVTLTI